jgi:hypothetical protein
MNRPFLMATASAQGRCTFEVNIFAPVRIKSALSWLLRSQEVKQEVRKIPSTPTSKMCGFMIVQTSFE